MHEPFDEENTDYTATTKSNNLILALKQKQYSADYPYYTDTEVYLDNKRIYPALITDPIGGGGDDGYDYYYVDWKNTNAEQHQIHVRVVDKNRQEEPNNYYVSMEMDESLAKLESVMWFIGSGDSTTKTGRFLPYSMFANPIEFDPDVNEYVLSYSMYQTVCSSTRTNSMLAFQVYPEKEDDVWAWTAGNMELWHDDDGEEYYVWRGNLPSLSVQHSDGSGYNVYNFGAESTREISLHQNFMLVNGDLVEEYGDRMDELLDSYPDGYDRTNLAGIWADKYTTMLDIKEDVVDSNYELRAKWYELCKFRMGLFNSHEFDVPIDISHRGSFIKPETWLEDDAPDIEATLYTWKVSSGKRCAIIPNVNGSTCPYSVVGDRHIVYPRSRFYNGWNTLGFTGYDVETGAIILNYEVPLYRIGADERIHEIEYTNAFKDFTPYDYAVGKVQQTVNNSIAGVTRAYREHISKLSYSQMLPLSDTNGSIYCGFADDKKNFTLYDSNGEKYKYPIKLMRYSKGVKEEEVKWENGMPLPCVDGVNTFTFIPMNDSVNPRDYLHKYCYSLKHRLGFVNKVRFSPSSSSSSTFHSTVVPFSSIPESDVYNVYLDSYGYYLNDNTYSPVYTEAIEIPQKEYCNSDSWEERYKDYQSSSTRPYTASRVPYYYNNGYPAEVTFYSNDGDKVMVKFILETYYKNRALSFANDNLWNGRVSYNNYLKTLEPTGYTFTGVTYEGTTYSALTEVPWLDGTNRAMLHFVSDDGGEFMDIIYLYVRHTYDWLSWTVPVSHEEDIGWHLRSDNYLYHRPKAIVDKDELYADGTSVAMKKMYNNKPINILSATYDIISPDTRVVLSSGDLVLTGSDSTYNYYNVPDNGDIPYGSIIIYNVKTDWNSEEIGQHICLYVGISENKYSKYIFQDPECTIPWCPYGDNDHNHYLRGLTSNYKPISTSGFYTKDPNVHIKYITADWKVEPLDGYDGVYYVKPIEKIPELLYTSSNMAVFEFCYGDSGEAISHITLVQG